MPGDREWPQAFGFLEGMRRTGYELAVKNLSERIFRGCPKNAAFPQLDQKTLDSPLRDPRRGKVLASQLLDAAAMVMNLGCAMV